jgi:hypothetical protein
MRAILLVLSSCVLIVFSCCNNTVKYKTVNHYSLFDLDVPGDFKTVIVPGADAKFQLGNYSDDFYVTVSFEGIDELEAVGIDYDLEMYSKFCIENVNTSLDSPVLVVLSEGVERCNMMRKKSYTITGLDELSSELTFNYISFFKSNSKFYAVVTCCMESSRSKYLNVMEHIHSSFKEK